MCVSDFHWGAMENWDLVIYRETYLLYDPTISSVEERYLATSVIAHELSHQVILNVYDEYSFIFHLASNLHVDRLSLNIQFLRFMHPIFL